MAQQNPKSVYEKILQAEKESTVQEIIDRENSRKIRVHMPCKVVRVRKNSVDVEIQGMEDSGFGYYVKFPQLLDLPVIYNNYTAKAYIITPIQVGDTGLVEFLDFNASGFSDSGNTAISSDQFPHSLNNGVFINGYIPDNVMVLDDATLANPLIMGLHNKTFLLSVTDSGKLSITSTDDIDISGKNINITASNNLTLISGATTSITGGTTTSITGTTNMNITGATTSITGSSAITITGNGQATVDGVTVKTHKHTDSLGGSTSAPL